MRVAPVIELTDEQQGELTKLARSKTTSVRLAQRAQIEDIVKRKTEISAENIVISLLNLGD